MLHPTMQSVYAKVKRLGGSIDLGDERINLDAPAGKVWAANLCHTIACAPRRGDKRNDYALDLMVDVDAGLTDCTVPDCDICEETN